MSIAIDKLELEASICKESFYEFVQRFWSVLITEKPVWNWHIEFLCNDLQKIAERVFQGLPCKYDYIVNIPPGTTKSTIISIMFPAWVFTRMKSAQIICASHTDTLVLDLSTKCRQIVISEKYQQLFPEVQVSDDQNTKGYWKIKDGGWRFSCTVGGKSPMGFHGHFLIVDDPIDPQKVLSDAEIKDAKNFMDNVLSSRKINAEISSTILVMQRLHQEDPTGNRLRKKNAGPVRHVCLPAELSDRVRPVYLKKKYKNGLLDPIRLPKKVLHEKKMSMGAFGYAGQYEQNPTPLSGGMFKTDRLKFGRAPREAKEWRMIVRYWDKAGSVDGEARTAGVKMGLDRHGRFWVLHVRKGRWESAERERIIFQTAKIDGVDVIVGVEQEPGSGGKESAQNTVRRLAGWIVRTIRPSGDKFIRADPFSVQVNEGNVYIDEGGEWVEEYIEEMLHFGPGARFKDQIDASAGAFSLLTQPVRRAGAIRIQ